MWLCLPTLFFRIVGWCLTILPPHGLYSNVAFDLQNGRKTMIATSLGVVRDRAEIRDRDASGEQVLKRVLELEPEEGRARADMLRKPEAEMLDDRRDSLVYGASHPAKRRGRRTHEKTQDRQKSVREFRRWLLKACSVVGIVFVLYLLFVHEHDFEEALEFTEGHHDQGML